MALGKNRAYRQGIGIVERTFIVNGVDNAPDIGTRSVVAAAFGADYLREDDVVTMLRKIVTTGGVESDITSSLRTFRGAKTEISEAAGANTSLDYTAKTPLTTRIEYVIGGSEVVVTVVNDSATQVTIKATFPNPTATRDIASAIRNHYVAGRLVIVNNTTGHNGSGNQTTAKGPYTLGTDPDANTAGAIVGYNNNQGGAKAYAMVKQGASSDFDFIIEARQPGLDTSLQPGQAWDLTITDTDQPVLSVTYTAGTGNLTIDLATVATVPVSTYAQVVAAINAKAAADPTFPFVARLANGNDGTGVAAAQGNATFASLGSAGEDSGLIIDGDHATAPSTIWVTVERRENAPDEKK